MLDLSIAEIQFALDAVRQAASLAQRIQAEIDPAAWTKGDRSPVTVADFAAQAVVGALLLEAFPGDPLVAEEDAAPLRTPDGSEILRQVTQIVSAAFRKADAQQVCSWVDRGAAVPAERFWTLDPIDGTKGFLRGDQYAVALALVENGQVRLGVLGCPNLDLKGGFSPGGGGALVIAARGLGCWATSLHAGGHFIALRVSDRQDPRQARLLRSFEAAHTNSSLVDRIAAVLGVEAQPIRMDSQAKYALLAAGRGELMLRLLSPDKPGYREKIWDQAAGTIILEQAGGQITDLDGNPLDFSAGRTLARNRGVLASNQRLHPAALQAIKAVRA